MESNLQEMSEALYGDGNRYLAQGHLLQAEACFRQAVVISPDFGEALTNLGYVLDQRGDTVAAEEAYLRAKVAGGNSVQLNMNLGALFASQKRFEEAERAYRDAIGIDPQSSATWSNLGGLYIGLRRYDEAEQHLEKAIAIDPGNAKAKFNLSYIYLRQGRYEEGWRCFEARDWYAPLARHFSIPRWSGEPLRGRRLVIGYEGGHGDVIHFSRYIPLIKDLGAADITLICHSALKGLMETLTGVSSVVGFDEDVGGATWDYWTPLMSIPLQLGTREENIPSQTPYLRADEGLARHWALQLPTAKVRIGLVWKGNPKFENDADRSFPSLRVLHPLWQVKGVAFVSLQKGAGEDEVTSIDPEFAIINLGSQMKDFADAAAIVAGLDLVICVDTAIAHLTGAIGRPCWVMLPHFMPDWRWGVDGAGSAWYPDQMRLFRQEERAGWDGLVSEIRDALEAFVQSRGSKRLGVE